MRTAAWVLVVLVGVSCAGGTKSTRTSSRAKTACDVIPCVNTDPGADTKSACDVEPCVNTDPGAADTKSACNTYPCVNTDSGAADTKDKGEVDGTGGATKPTPCYGSNCVDGAT